MKSLSSLLILTVVSSCFFSPKVLAGKESGGGIIIAAEFATAGRQALKIISDGDPSLNLVAVLETIKETKVIPVDGICYTDPVLNKEYCEDAHYDAKNNVILLSHAKWDSLSCKEKLVLSTHELLRAAGMESEDYGYSGRFISEKLAKCQERASSPQDLYSCDSLTVVIQNKIELLCRSLIANSKDRHKK